MTPHHIRTAFNGSQTGNDFQHFPAGTTALLSADLARIAVAEGWAEPIPPTEARETKVLTPAETKPAARKKGR